VQEAHMLLPDVVMALSQGNGINSVPPHIDRSLDDQIVEHVWREVPLDAHLPFAANVFTGLIGLNAPQRVQKAPEGLLRFVEQRRKALGPVLIRRWDCGSATGLEPLLARLDNISVMRFARIQVVLK